MDRENLFQTSGNRPTDDLPAISARHSKSIFALCGNELKKSVTGNSVPNSAKAEGSFTVIKLGKEFPVTDFIPADRRDALE
jgi:hypothetical protein